MEVHTYEFRTYTSQHEAGVEVDRRVRRFMADNSWCKDYAEAMGVVLRADEDLKVAYADVPPEEDN